jgi:hypothetical protein
MERREFLLGFATLIAMANDLPGKTNSSRPVMVAAGRRVDAPGATEPRFPPGNVELVRGRIEKLLEGERPLATVSAAACGADLLLLQASIRLEREKEIPTVRRTILLPSSPEEFRKSSVTDRPGDWGTIYDEVLKHSTVQVLNLPPGDEGYLQANLHLLKEAESIAKTANTRVVAVVIWNGKSRGNDDVTAHFLDEAGRRGIPTIGILTL